MKRSLKFELALKKESEIWLYSYADLITNLLAFFLMLLIMSRSDDHAMEKIQESISKAVGGKTVTKVVKPLSAAPQTQAPVVNNPEASMVDSVSDFIKRKKLEKNVSVEKNKNGISLTLSGAVFFETSSEKLSKDAKTLLERLGPIFVKIPAGHVIDVEGHADSRPLVKNQRFPSNWELSAARAGSVVRFLVSHGLNENSMRAIGYGNTKPVSQELHANRRVVISIRKERRDE